MHLKLTFNFLSFKNNEKLSWCWGFAVRSFTLRACLVCINFTSVMAGSSSTAVFTLKINNIILVSFAASAAQGERN